MSVKLNPYLSFDDNAREAMEFYQSVLGGELTVMTFGQMGATPAEGVMHSSLVTPDGMVIMASDTPAELTWEQGFVNITMSISGDEPEKMRGYFEALAEGGTVRIPMAKQAWGDEFGMLTDKYGVGWMVNIASDSTQG